MAGYKTHVFVCTNGADKAGKCAHKGSEKLRNDLKAQCKSEFGQDVRVNAAGCLGYCEEGITCVIYTEEQPAKWYLNIKEDDKELLLKAVKKSLGK